MAARGAGQSVSLLKQAWHEKPDLVLSCSLGVAGIFVTMFSVAKHWGNEAHDRAQKFHYTVIRREDVKDEKLLKDVYN